MSESGPLRRSVTVTDPYGLHPRPATAFAQLANRYDCRVTVWYGEKPANGKTPWDLIMLVALPGSELVVEVEGPEAEAALEPLATLLATPMND
jgi:phosphotransferase system HPr (HPr) family protein